MALAMIAESMLIYILILLLTGMVVGFACGMLGVGGGFIMVPVQIWALTSMGVDPTLSTRVAFGTSLAVILPTSLCGCHGHICQGVVLWRQGVTLGLSGLVGALLGGTIAAHAPGELLRMIFGLVILAGALRMIFARELRRSRPQVVEGLVPYVLWGVAIGLISGLTGIGGGVILVPAMVIAMGFTMYQAVGTSTVAIAFNAMGGTISYAINGWGVARLPAHCVGYIDLLQFILLAGASMLTAHWGANATHKISEQKLKRVFVALMIIIGLKMMGLFNWIGF
ncbi:MAG: sulfite exporter TauE/SafE family protein [Methanothrix sp.]|nr:sulfite exporter TauE/SafE family protein [Methanothrix sp.]